MTAQVDTTVEQDGGPVDEEVVTIPLALYATFIRTALFARDVLGASFENDGLASRTVQNMAEGSELIAAREMSGEEVAAMDPPPAADALPIYAIGYSAEFIATLDFLDEARRMAIEAASEQAEAAE